MKKKAYEAAELELVLFEYGDIVTASSPDPADTDWEGGRDGAW